MKLRRWLGTLALLNLAGTPIQAQRDHWDRQVAKALDRTAVTLKDRGYRPVTPYHSGILLVEQSDQIEVPLAPKREYLMVGACDDDCTGLQLVIANGIGYQVDAARGPGNSPVVRVTTPAQSGTYRVTVTMAACRVSPCRYGFAVFVR